MRTMFAFEKDNVFKFERMQTKFINLQVRRYILQEILYVKL